MRQNPQHVRIALKEGTVVHVSHPPAFGSKHLGDRLGPRGSGKRWFAATALAAAMAFVAGVVAVAAIGGSFAAALAFGLAFVVLEILFMLGLAGWLRRRRTKLSAS